MLAVLQLLLLLLLRPRVCLLLLLLQLLLRPVCVLVVLLLCMVWRARQHLLRLMWRLLLGSCRCCC